MPIVPEILDDPEERMAAKLRKHAKPIENKSQPPTPDLRKLYKDRKTIEEELLSETYSDPNVIAKRIILNKLGFAYANKDLDAIGTLSNILNNPVKYKDTVVADANNLKEYGETNSGSEIPSFKQAGIKQLKLAAAYQSLAEKLLTVPG